METDNIIAYFSMEIALEAGMPTYSGGLGVLAGDTVRTAADLNIPMVAVTLLHRQGYFYQRLDAHGWQHEEPAPGRSMTLCTPCQREPPSPSKGARCTSAPGTILCVALEAAPCRCIFWMLICRTTRPGTAP